VPVGATYHDLYATVIHATTGNFHQVTADDLCITESELLRIQFP
jgi:hypothetical protein